MPDKKGYIRCGLGEYYKVMKFGYISMSGEVLIPIEFYELESFDDNDMAVYLPRRGGYVRRDGKVFDGDDYIHLIK